jgi:hypothetical protein
LIILIFSVRILNTIQRKLNPGKKNLL